MRLISSNRRPMPRIKTPPVASNSATMRGLKNESSGRGALLDVEVRLEHLGEWLCARYIRIPTARNLVTAKVSGPHLAARRAKRVRVGRGVLHSSRRSTRRDEASGS